MIAAAKAANLSAPMVYLIGEHAHTCYLDDCEHRHAWSYGCGKSPFAPCAPAATRPGGSTATPRSPTP